MEKNCFQNTKLEGKKSSSTEGFARLYQFSNKESFGDHCFYNVTTPFFPFINFVHPCQPFLPVISTINVLQQSSGISLQQASCKQENVQSEKTEVLPIKRKKKSMSYTDWGDLRQNQKSSSEDQNQTKRRLKHNANAWSYREDHNYIKFLKNNRHLFELPVAVKKAMKLNVLMSLKIGSRSPEQCHSHHQKLVAKYGSIDAVLTQHKAAISAQQQRKKCKKLVQLKDMPSVKRQEKDCQE